MEIIFYFIFVVFMNYFRVLIAELPRQKYHQDILTKPKLKTKTDLILQKYLDKKDD